MTVVTRTWGMDAIEKGIASARQDGAGMARVPVRALSPGTREGGVPAVEETTGSGGASSSPRIAMGRAAADDALRRSREPVSWAARRDPWGDFVLRGGRGGFFMLESP